MPVFFLNLLRASFLVPILEGNTGNNPSVAKAGDMNGFVPAVDYTRVKSAMKRLKVYNFNQ